MSRLLITGASGLLGVNLALLASAQHEVVGTSRRALRAAPFETVPADLVEGDAVPRLLDRCQPEIVFQCAAAADVDYCEQHPHEARGINAEAAGRMAAECGARRIRLVHISTDAVFDGQKEGAYRESDIPRPQGVYAMTKLEGEQAVKSANPDAIVVRVNFFGWSISGHRSLGEFFVNNLGRGITVNGFTDVIFCPMFVGHLAGLLVSLGESRLHGLYHAVGAQAMSKLEFGWAIADQFGYDRALITPRSVDEAGLKARRAHNLRLDSSKLSTDMGAILPDFSTGLREFHKQFLEGFPQRIQSFQPAGRFAGAEQPMSGQAFHGRNR